MSDVKFPDPGEKPVLLWIGKTSLRIDKRYQRDVSTKRGQKLVAKLVAEWRWAHCLPIVVTDNFDGSYNVIDGQHRLSAACDRSDILDLPCYVVATETLQDEAQAFVAYNRDRVQLTPLAVYHALVAAKDPEATTVARACREAGVVVLTAPKMMDICAPNEAQCIGALRTIARRYGGGHLGRCLKILMAAWPGADAGSGLRSMLVNGVAEMLKETPELSDKVVAAGLGGRGPELWLDRARGARHAHNGRSQLAFIADLRKVLARKAP